MSFFHIKTEFPVGNGPNYINSYQCTQWWGDFSRRSRHRFATFGKNRELNLVFLILHKESREIASINLSSSFRSVKARLPESKGTRKDSTIGDCLTTLNTVPEENLRCTISHQLFCHGRKVGGSCILVLKLEGSPSVLAVLDYISRNFSWDASFASFSSILLTECLSGLTHQPLTSI